MQESLGDGLVDLLDGQTDGLVLSAAPVSIAVFAFFDFGTQSRTEGLILLGLDSDHLDALLADLILGMVTPPLLKKFEIPIRVRIIIALFPKNCNFFFSAQSCDGKRYKKFTAPAGKTDDKFTAGWYHGPWAFYILP